MVFSRIYKKHFFVVIFALFLFPLRSNAQVVLNEVMYDLSGTDTGREWVEIYNAGSSVADLLSWKFFENNTNHGLNSVSGGTGLAAGGYAIIADDSVKFLLDWPSFSGILFDSAFSLNNTGETISLKDDTQTIVDEVTYQSTTGANGDSNSLQKSEGSWIAAAPTPGLANATNSSSSSSASTIEETTVPISSGQRSSNTITVTTYYVSTPLTNVDKETKFVVGAGRDRLGSVGSPLEFKAEADFDHTRNIIFKWNFGDGHEGFGKVLGHTYEYSGDYVVMLNVSSPEEQAVARVNVKIIEPEIVVTLATPERIELRNNSKYEVSLFGKALVSSGKTFVFPQDTIIKAGQNISFSANLTDLRPNDIQSVNVLTIGEKVTQPYLAVNIEKQKSEEITTIRNKLTALEEQRQALLQKEISNSKIRISTSNNSSTSQIASALDSVPQVKSTGKTGKWFETLKKFFLRTK